MGNPPQSYSTSPAVSNHTVLPATRHPSQPNWYSIYLPWRDGRPSWPRWMVTYWDGLPTCRWLPIQLLTGLDVLIETNMLLLSHATTH